MRPGPKIFSKAKTICHAELISFPVADDAKPEAKSEKGEETEKLEVGRQGVEFPCNVFSLGMMDSCWLKRARRV